MSSSRKSKPVCFESDIRRLLLAAEAGQKADILTYYSGHLGPRSLNQNQPHRDTKQVIWKMSQSREENPNPLKLLQRQTIVPTYVREKELKESPSEFTAATGSRQNQATVHSSHACREELSLPKIVHSSLNSLLVHPRAFSHKKPKLPCIPKQQKQLYYDHFHHKGLNNEDQLKTKQRRGRPFVARQDAWAGINIAEMHERKLQKALKKLSAQSWPHRDRLAVFSDVFDDVCESSPVFGRILREIKTDYDLYVNHMMASHSPPHMLMKSAFEILDTGTLTELDLEDAEAEVYRLEQEARRALEENKRVRNELENVRVVIGPGDSDMKNTSLSGLKVSGTANSNSVHIKRLQVLNMWREIQQLEEEFKEKLVFTVTTTATESSIKVLKTKIMRLIASNDRLKTANKNMESKINMILNKEKSSKTLRRLLWDEIHSSSDGVAHATVDKVQNAIM